MLGDGRDLDRLAAWQIEALRRFGQLQRRFDFPLGPADGPQKRYLRGNNARLYGFSPGWRQLDGDAISRYKVVYESEGAGRTNLAYGYAKR